MALGSGTFCQYFFFFNSWIWDSFSFICIFFHFTNVIVLVYKSFTSLDKFISKYFIGFEVIVNEITYFSDNLFSVNRNTTDTCTLIFTLKLYWICWLELKDFQWYLGFSIHKTMFSSSRYNFLSYFPNQVPFIYLFIVLAWFIGNYFQ